MSKDQRISFDDVKVEIDRIIDAKEKIEHLLRPRQEFIQTHPQEFLDLCEHLRAQAESDRQQHAASLGTLGVARALDRLGRNEDAAGAYQAALAHLESIGDDYWCGFARQRLGNVALEQGDFAEAGRQHDRALQHYRKIEHAPGIASSLRGIAQMHGRSGNFEEAVTAGIEALRLDQQGGDRSGEAASLLLLSQIHASLEDDERVEEYLQRTIALATEIGDDDIVARGSHNLGELYLENGRAAEAEAPLRRTLAIFEERGGDRGIAKALGSLGRLREVEERFEEALVLYEQSLVKATEVEDAVSCAIIGANLGSVLLKLERYDEAERHLVEARRFAVTVGMRPLEQGIEIDRSEVAAAVGDFEKAFQLSTRSENLLGEILAEDRTRALQEMQVRFDVERAVHEKEVLRLRNEQLEMMIDERTKELASMALHLVEKAEMLESFGKQVRKIAAAARDDAQTLAKGILSDLDRNDLGDDWERFEQQLDATQGGFVRTLGAAYPELSSTELRIAALLKIGLATKEIAGLLTLSQRSIESHRYHLRKKVGLEESRTLLSFLRGFEEENASRRAVSEDRSLGRILRTDYPDLSEAERKVCVLTRNGLKTKEIAEFLGVSVRTIETHRYRIRKKLEMKKGENLRGFLDRL